MDRDEAELVRSTLRHLVESTAPSDLPDALVASGWSDLLDADPATTITALGEEQGALNLATPAIDLVMSHGAGLDADAATVWILPPLRRDATTAADATGAVDGLVTVGHDRAFRYVALGPDGVVEIDPTAVTVDPIDGIDAEAGLGRAHGPSAVSGPPAAGSEGAGSALAAGRRFLASELVGLSSRMLAETVEYVQQREQFGRSIATFQTVKHRLADVHVGLEAARAAVMTAHLDQDPRSAMGAKALAGRAHRTAMIRCQQVHGGIAFTVEHGFDRLVRRGLLLDAVLGSADDLTRELGALVLATGEVPRSPTLRI